MRLPLFVALAALILQTGPALADPPAHMLAPRALIGVWAGERMKCQNPNRLLHVYRRERTFHPSVYEDEIGYACRILSVRGRNPNYRLHLQCSSFGKGRKTMRHRVLQAAQLQEAGKRMHIVTWDAKNGEPLRQDHLYRCRDIDAPDRRPLHTS